jgi:uncharacterized protein YjbJ (UPF0337 family)
LHWNGIYGNHQNKEIPMISQQTLKGNWTEIAGELHSKWGQLNSDELQQFKGDAAQLVGYIQRKTGEAKDKIEGFLHDLGTSGGNAVSRAAGTVKDFASQALHTAKEGADSVADHARSGYATAERAVKHRPATSVAAAFGTGLVVGAVLSLLMRPQR